MKKLLAVLIAFMAVGFVAGCSVLGGSITKAPDEAQAALKDAADCADGLVDRYRNYGQEAPADEESTDAARSYEDATDEIDEGIARIQADIDAIETSDGTWLGRDQAIGAMKNLQGALAYERDILEAQHEATGAAEGKTGSAAALATMEALYDGYSAVDPPDCLKAYLNNTIDTLPTIGAALAYNLSAPNSTLSQRTTNELLTWWITKQGAYDEECNDILVQQCQASGDLLRGIAEGKQALSNPTVNASMIDEIAPNLYPSLDSAVNLGITSYDDEHSVQIEVEVAGFSQKYEQKYDLAQGYNYLPIKPALLSSKDMPNLTKNTTTHLNVKVTDAQSGEVLMQESHPVDLLSMYDVRWTNDEFGMTASFDILAWLRPQADEVNAINRAAADVISDWTNGKSKIINGYQESNPLSTLIQVAAIQKAISDAGVTYVMDGYSFTSDQHVLTPEAVIKKRQGLCIETSLLMASCLMSADMHPLIIITPGHAQVAVETYTNSGNYLLIETTTLPYAGIDSSAQATDPFGGVLATSGTASGSNSVSYWTSSGSPAEWEAYFKAVGNSSMEYDGIFVIDCNLQQIMDIQGLENI